ncbi:MAG: BtpA/SgcQ family protein [Myxococcales bacterium]|nr:BtpA/SgcQ family protein [Myxococcales bacterium]MCB9668447.1 BtpA/SgcQ family protein [Alphaproteobacteria bacterium]MCB9690685.1 BtpA/SgcQ family protein [Alphaproteobacteria bacterium]
MFASPPALSDGRPALVGMVHLEALPGAPGWQGDLQRVLAAADRDAHRLVEGGCDALLVENMGDLPWLRGSVPPWTVAAMALAVERVVALGKPTGLQVLAAANREALGIAVATGARFVRVEGFAWAHVADEGWIDACAGELLRDRRALGADVAVWADVQKKHSAHAVTADLSLADLAHGTAFAGADVLIATGTSTGRPTSPADVDAMKAAGLPVAVGSGVTPESIPALRAADALIVGSWLKEDGDWRRPVDTARVRALRVALDAL